MKRTIAILAAILALAIPLVISNTADMTVTVGNTAPILDNIKINGIDSGATVNPTAGNTTTVILYAEATDTNGWADVTEIKCTVTGPGTVEGSPVNLILDQLDSDTRNATGTFTMDFYDASGTYTVTCTAKDASGATGSKAETYSYTSSTALDLDAGTIAFGWMNPGATTTVTGNTTMEGPTTTAPTIKNQGNAQIDATISGTDLSGPSTIGVGNVTYQFSALGFNVLTTGGTTETLLNLAAGASSTTNVDFSLYVPIGTVTGIYTGTTTIIAVSG